MPDAVLGWGTTLDRNPGSGYVTIVRNVEIGPFGAKGDDVDVTAHDSDSGFKRFMRGLMDAGELSFEGLWIAGASQTVLPTDVLGGLDSDTTYPYRVVLPGGYGTFAASAYLRDIELEGELEGTIKIRGVLKWLGQPTFTTTASAGLTTPFFTVSGAGTLIVPAAAQAVYDYVVNIATAVTSVTITPTAAAGTITVNGNTVVSGQASSAITLGAAGSITTATINVVETAKTLVQYILRLTRATA